MAMRLSEFIQLYEGYEERVEQAAAQVVKQLQGVGGLEAVKRELHSIANGVPGMPDYNGSKQARSEFIKDVFAAAKSQLKAPERPLAGAALAASLKPSLDLIWVKAEEAVGQSIPDGDPMGYLSGWMRRNDVSMDDVDRAAKKHGYKSFYTYVADVWEDATRDALHDAQDGHYGEDYSNEWFAQPNPWK